MKIDINGIVREMTPEEEQELNNSVEVIPYAQRVVNRIREVYSIDDELAILRQRDTKPDEFAEYNEFVESCKKQAKEEVYEEITKAESMQIE